MADRILKVVLDVVPKASGAFQKALGIGSGSSSAIAGATSAVASPSAVTSVTRITNGFSAMHKELADLNTAIRPDLIAKQAALEVKLASAREKYDKALTAAKPKGGLFGSGISGLALLGGAGAGIAGGLASVGARSPATMEKFERALLDVTAVVGDTFQPVLEVVTEGVRLFGDVLATILPNAHEMREIIAPVSQALGTLRTALEPLTPFIKGGLMLALKALAGAAQAAADALNILAPGEQRYAEIVAAGAEKASNVEKFTVAAQLLQFKLPSETTVNKLQSSRGMAATSASFVSGEDRGRQAYSAAFASGATKSAQEKTAENTKDIADELVKQTGILGFVAESLLTRAGLEALIAAKQGAG